MATQVIGTAPYFIALSTEIVGGKIKGAFYVGAKIYLSDTREWKIVLQDLTIADYKNPSIDINTGSQIVSNDFEQLTIDNTVGGVALTPAKYGVNSQATISVENARIRFRVDGGVPTDTIGHIAEIGDVINLTSFGDIVNFRAIRITTTNALITATYGTTV